MFLPLGLLGLTPLEEAVLSEPPGLVARARPLGDTSSGDWPFAVPPFPAVPVAQVSCEPPSASPAGASLTGRRGWGGSPPTSKDLVSWPACWRARSRCVAVMGESTVAMSPPLPRGGDAPACPAELRGGRASRRHPRRHGAPRAAAAVLALGVAAATWRHSWRSCAFGVSSPTAQTAASSTREPRVRLGAVKERQEEALKEKEESLNLKADDIGAMYATGDADMDELADSTWKEHFNVAFKSVDLNNDGKICFDEFARVLSDTGPPFTNVNEDGVKILFSLADSDSNGHLDFDEFITWQKSTRSLLDSFLKLDLDHDGVISKDEWRVALGKAGLDWTAEECNESFDGADTNGDGFLDFAEYTMWAAKA